MVGKESSGGLPCIKLVGVRGWLWQVYGRAENRSIGAIAPVIRSEKAVYRTTSPIRASAEITNSKSSSSINS